MWWLKGFGMGLIFFCCTACGFLKAAGIKQRSEKLLSFSSGLHSLAERIRIGGGEINSLLPLCFSEELITVTQSGFSINKNFLKSEDTALLEEFLYRLGMGDCESEYRRTQSYAALTEERYRQSREECDSLCKLYKSLGSLIGIFICIFFL